MTNWISQPMRLQCPNCDAEYEVGASAIPFDGRDVQCSNCGHGWFQAHPDFEVDYAIESALYDPPPPLAQGSETPLPIPRRELDPEALRVLREEVALEEAKRAEDAARANAVAKPTPLADGPEAVLDAMVAKDARDQRSGAQVEGQANVQAGKYRSSPDTEADLRDIEAELDAEQNAQAQNANFGAPLPRVSPRRVARLKGLNDDAVTQNAPMSAAPQTAPVMPQPDAGVEQGQDLRGDFANAIPKPRQKSGSRAGFYTVMLAMLAAAAGYVFGPDLAKAVPDLAAPMGHYITLVNSLRDQVQVIVPQALGMAEQVLALAKGAVQSVLDWVAAQGWI
jgi:predicted Zn finger-like uncharacterized protein